MAELILEKQVLDIMKHEALQAFPNECCGFFFGREEEERRFVFEVFPVENKKEGDQRRRFEIEPESYMKAERYGVDKGLDFLGIYHSHPLHPAIPSEHDRSQAMPWFSYIILSVEQEAVVDVTSWQLNQNRQFEKETLKQH